MSNNSNNNTNDNNINIHIEDEVTRLRHIISAQDEIIVRYWKEVEAANVEASNLRRLLDLARARIDLLEREWLDAFEPRTFQEYLEDVL